MIVQSLLSFFQLGLQNGITFDLRRKIQQIIEVKKELMKLHVLTSRGVILSPTSSEILFCNSILLASNFWISTLNSQKVR
jgi:hypothetical protein